VSGPYIHENLAVFLLHAKDQDSRDYMTLDQGLDKKLVTVSEQGKEQVGSLVIENKSDRYLFLQEGDRIQGGKQDRIIVTSLVIPPKSGKMPLPTFCCEASRWQLGRSGKEFGNVENAVLAPQSVRVSAKYIAGRGGQGIVWDKVAEEKGKSTAKFGSGNTNSSLNETLDSAQVKKVCEACGKAMNGLPAKHPDAIGVAVAVNGKVEEVNLYPNAKLFAQVFPRLVQSYAIQAALEKDKLKGKEAPKVAAEQVTKFMESGQEKARRFEGIDDGNRIRLRDLGGELESATSFKGSVIHRQWINKEALPEPKSKK
jgi:hypothetical protein